jgi:uncharacterized membrane protein YccC
MISVLRNVSLRILAVFVGFAVVSLLIGSCSPEPVLNYLT